MPKQRGETGQFVETVTLEEVLEVFDEVEGPPVVTSGDVADATGVSRDSARRKLEELQERGEVDSRRTAGRVLYWRVDDVRDDPEPRALQEPAREDIAASDLPGGGEGRREATPSATNHEVDTGETASTVTETGESVPADFDELVRQVGEEALPGSGAKLEGRQEAFTAVVEYLREQGSATPQDFREGVYPDHQAMYTDGKNPPRSWWKNAMYPALRDLAKRTTVIEQADTSGEWTWREAER
jgi:ribosomal protein S25